MPTQVEQEIPRLEARDEKVQQGLSMDLQTLLAGERERFRVRIAVLGPVNGSYSCD